MVGSDAAGGGADEVDDDVVEEVAFVGVDDEAAGAAVAIAAKRRTYAHEVRLIISKLPTETRKTFEVFYTLYLSYILVVEKSRTRVNQRRKC